jgi:hypothetical protein
LQAAADEALRHALDALALRSVQIADRKPIALDLLDHARREQFSGRIDHTADDALARDVPLNRPGRIDAGDRAALERSTVLVEIPEGNAVLHRHDHRARSEELRDVGGNRLDLVRLHGEDHDDLAVPLPNNPRSL